MNGAFPSTAFSVPPTDNRVLFSPSVFIPLNVRRKETLVKPYRVLMIAAFVGGIALTTGTRANAQDLLSTLLYGLVTGSPSGPSANFPSPLYGSSPYDPYGGVPYGGPYGGTPSYDPYGFGRSGYYEPPGGSYGPYPDYHQGRDGRYQSQEHLGRLSEKYNKAMRRLDRQESEARAKAYRKSQEDPSRNRERMAKIERKYQQKRYQVERNTAKEYRHLSDRYGAW